MYCVKCGAELADSEKKCPLCGTTAFHPDVSRKLADPPYPAERRLRAEDVNRSGVLFVLTVLALLPAVICLLCDWRINNTIVWSGFASGAIVLAYVLIILPLWFRRPNPVIFVPVDFAAIGLYLLYINWATGGHWFLSFALPVTGAIGLLVSTVIYIIRQDQCLLEFRIREFATQVTAFFLAFFITFGTFCFLFHRDNQVVVFVDMNLEVFFGHSRSGDFYFVVFVTFNNIDGGSCCIGFYHPVVIKEIIKNTW